MSLIGTGEFERAQAYQGATQVAQMEQERRYQNMQIKAAQKAREGSTAGEGLIFGGSYGPGIAKAVEGLAGPSGSTVSPYVGSHAGEDASLAVGSSGGPAVAGGNTGLVTGAGSTLPITSAEGLTGSVGGAAAGVSPEIAAAATTTAAAGGGTAAGGAAAGAGTGAAEGSSFSPVGALIGAGIGYAVGRFM